MDNNTSKDFDGVSKHFNREKDGVITNGEKRRPHSGSIVQFGGRERLLSTIYRIENAVEDFLNSNADRLVAVSSNLEHNYNNNKSVHYRL